MPYDEILPLPSQGCLSFLQKKVPTKPALHAVSNTIVLRFIYCILFMKKKMSIKICYYVT